ncbi:hypothetical protein [Caenispirillum bisanense]|uniref:hypothetical protein n=1 Tax=Caenispirillum bisanense TaxID=414052 RepID=UPI0031D08A09
MRPDEKTAVRKPRRIIFTLWVAVGIAGGLFVLLVTPFTGRYSGHEVAALAALSTVFFFGITALGWLVYLAMSKRRSGRVVGPGTQGATASREAGDPPAGAHRRPH